SRAADWPSAIRPSSSRDSSGSSVPVMMWSTLRAPESTSVQRAAIWAATSSPYSSTAPCCCRNRAVTLSSFRRASCAPCLAWAVVARADRVAGARQPDDRLEDTALPGRAALERDRRQGGPRRLRSGEDASPSTHRRAAGFEAAETRGSHPGDDAEPGGDRR